VGLIFRQVSNHSRGGAQIILRGEQDLGAALAGGNGDKVEYSCSR
jgi:hypothetical protein